MENQAATEERNAYEKRKKAAEEARNQRTLRTEANDANDNAVLDTLLQKLRNGDSVGRRSRRTRAKTGPNVPSTLTLLQFNGSAGDEDSDTPIVATAALDMLARLKSDGFDALVPSTPVESSKPSRRRRPRKEPEDPLLSTELIPSEDEKLNVFPVEELNDGSIHTKELNTLTE